MLLHYLDGVRYHNYVGLVGTVYFVPDYRGGWRLIATYTDGTAHKGRIFNDLRKRGQKENIGEWEWHHIVEGNHLASVDFNGSLSVSYENDFPCVLIHGREEHSLYSRMFRTAAGRELYRNDHHTGNETKRMASARAEAKANPNWKALFLERTDRLITMYDDAYSGDFIMQQISRNVLQAVKRRIVAASVGVTAKLV
jgi:hypothetical protein